MQDKQDARYQDARSSTCMNENLQDEKDISRRAFLQAAATALAAVGIVGCGAPDNVSRDSNGDANGNANSGALGAAPPETATANVQRITEKLFSVSGGAKLKVDEALPFVIPTTSEPGVLLRDKGGKLHAMSARCTHVGCVVVWKNDAQNLACPCHNSQFDLTGKVLGGPATKPLPQWKAEIKGDDALVSI